MTATRRRYGGSCREAGWHYLPLQAVDGKAAHSPLLYRI